MSLSIDFDSSSLKRFCHISISCSLGNPLWPAGRKEQLLAAEVTGLPIALKEVSQACRRIASGLQKFTKGASGSGNLLLSGICWKVKSDTGDSESQAA